MTTNETASAPLLVSDTPLSFWGGVDPLTGDIVDEHHPLHKENIVNRIVAIPGSRGSCSGSGLLLELIMTGLAPAALIFCEQEEVLVLGAVVAQIMFDHPLPLLLLSAADFRQLQHDDHACIVNDTLKVASSHGTTLYNGKRLDVVHPRAGSDTLRLNASDLEKLEGKQGKALQVAMQILLCMARVQGARQLITIQQAHIDSCVYHGKSSLLFAETFVNWGARVAVPTTLNAISVDKRRWRSQGIDPAFGIDASALGDAYSNMGAQPSYTCAPYLLDTAPTYGDQIVWAESNAVAYANSILGARTQKYPDFLDVCIALTGRAPDTGAHRDAGRRPTLRISVDAPDNHDDAFWPLLGYHVGLLAPNDVPWVCGLENTAPSTDHLKAFSAAFATTSSVPLFHLASITPEALPDSSLLTGEAATDLRVLTVTAQDLATSWATLNSATTSRVDMVCLGNPHFSFTECESLVSLCQGKTRSPQVAVVVTLSRHVQALCDKAGLVKALETFGVQLVNDTCWCMLQQPVIPPEGSILMTTSAKYAHYAPGLVNRAIHFDSLSACVDAACSGTRNMQLPGWLSS